MRPTANELPSSGNGTLILTVENADCPGPQSVWFSWGSTYPVERSSTVDGLTYLELASPESPQSGDFLVMLTDGPSWTLTFLDPAIRVSCTGRSCNAAVTSGQPFYAIVSNMQVTSASQLEVVIADSAATFTLVSSNATETVLLITPPECTNCRFSSRSVHLMSKTMSA